MFRYFSILLVVVSFSCFGQSAPKPKILLLSTFHMKHTSDLRKVEFDPTDPKRKKEIEVLNEKLLKFAPTVICIEREPEKQSEIDNDYQAYQSGKELKLIAEDVVIGFAIGKKLGLKRIYGIDHKLDFNYQLAATLADSLKNKRYLDYLNSELTILKTFKPGGIENRTTLEVLQEINTERALNELYNLNAGIFTYVNTEKGFEGTDVASDYYKRNLRIYANLNKLPLKETDRVLVIMGGSHIAFLKDFISKSPVYTLADTEEILRK